MEIQVYSILIMFAVAASAFATAINSRGIVRVVISYVLASLILIFAVFTAVRYSQDKEIAKALKEREKMEEQIKKAETEARIALTKKIADSIAAISVAAPVAEQPSTSVLAPVAAEGLALSNAVLGVNVNDESKDYDQLVVQARSLQARAAALKRKFDSIAKESDPNRPTVEKGIRFITVATNTLSLYYRSENETEESERLSVYKQNANAAKTAFASVK